MKKFLLSIHIIFTFSVLLLSQPKLQFGDIGNLKLTSGDEIRQCKVGYRTFGQLNEDKSNAIIYPSWFGGTSESIASLIDKHNFIDTTKYYIIAIDALGNGISTSPSNYEMEFPQITIKDMVNAEYKLLTEILKINHLYAAVGGSMGSMQVLEWAVAYPDFISRIVAYVATPKMSSYDLLWMNTQLNMTESCLKQGSSEKEIKKILDMMTAMIARTPAYVVENTSVSKFPEYLASFDKEPSKIFTLADYIVQLKAMMKQDISFDFNESMTEAAKAIKAKLFIIVSKTDMMVNPTEAIKLADLTGAKKLILDNNCGHLAVSCELDRCKKEIADFLSD